MAYGRCAVCYFNYSSNKSIRPLFVFSCLLSDIASDENLICSFKSDAFRAVIETAVRRI